MAEEDVKSLLDAEDTTMTTPVKKKKKQNVHLREEEDKGPTQPEIEGNCESEPPAGNELPTPLKKTKKKRKIPVVIEVEAEELEEEAAKCNRLAVSGGKKPKISNVSLAVSTYYHVAITTLPDMVK